MFRALLLITALVAVCQGHILKPRAPMLDGRIVGGEDTTIENFPHQVSIRLFGSHTCGGSIIEPNVILTAAHCIYEGLDSFYSVQHSSTNVGGSSNTISVKRGIKHKEYDSKTINNDIALIILNNKISLNERARAIELVSETPAAGTTAIVSGWGTTTENGNTSNQLKKVKVEVVSNQKCNSQYSGVNEITPGMLCAAVNGGGKDACQGDSGGPLIAGGKQIGVVSWGVGCARPEYSGVYTNVAHFTEWIEENLPKV